MTKVLIIGGTGYVGSRLFQHLVERGFDVDTMDLELRGNFVNISNMKLDFQYLSAPQLRQYGSIVLLAGHSSVKQAIGDPYGAIDNNLFKFTNLISKLDGQKLVYASSSSVYTGVGGAAVDESWSTFNFSNMYDFTKYACDAIASLMYPNSYALRFGTVCGASPNIRNDLMINSMVSAGLSTGRINVFNGHIRRPILGINDLCQALELIIKDEGNPGVYNICSFNTTVDQVAEDVSRALNCELVKLPPSDAYDFSMESTKIAKVLGFVPKETVVSIIDDLVSASQG